MILSLNFLVENRHILDITDHKRYVSSNELERKICQYFYQWPLCFSLGLLPFISEIESPNEKNGAVLWSVRVVWTLTLVAYTYMVKHP